MRPSLSQHFTNVAAHLSLRGKGALEVAGGQQPLGDQPLAQ